MTRYNLTRDRVRAEQRKWLQDEAARISEAPQAPEVREFVEPDEAPAVERKTRKPKADES